MYREGEFLVHFKRGVCRVEEICMPDADKGSDKKFYRLITQGKTKAEIYSPIDGKETLMRPLMSECEAASLISHMPNIASLSVLSEKNRKEAYKKAVAEPYPANLVSVIKAVYERAEAKAKVRKKLAAFELEYSALAKDILYTEMGIALGIPIDTVEDYIVDKIEG